MVMLGHAEELNREAASREVTEASTRPCHAMETQEAEQTHLCPRLREGSGLRQGMQTFARKQRERSFKACSCTLIIGSNFAASKLSGSRPFGRLALLPPHSLEAIPHEPLKLQSFGNAQTLHTSMILVIEYSRV